MDITGRRSDMGATSIRIKEEEEEMQVMRTEHIADSLT